MRMKQLPQVIPNLIWRVLNEETVVVSPVDGKYCVLNGSGTVIWQLLVENCSLAGIEEHLAEYYEISREQARKDITLFLSDLQRRGLLVWGA